jgi:hypothetical protein
MVGSAQIIVCAKGESPMSLIIQKLTARLGLGQLPEALRDQLESEGRILYLAEGILETALFRNYRAPSVYSSHRRMAFIGYFALSERRMVARAKGYHQIDVNMAYDDPRFQKITFAVRPKFLSLAFDASTQNAQASGQVEVRLHLPDIAAAARMLEQAGARMG